MNFEELLDYLDLEEAGQFEYFEALADLVECEEPIEMEAIYKLFEGADKETVATLLEDYFEDILDGLPENADAGEVNQFFSEHGVYDSAGNLLWEMLEQTAGVSVRKQDAAELQDGELDQELAAGRYPIVRVKMPKSGSYHYVLLVGSADGTYLCMDPLQTKEQTVPLSDFGGKIYAVRVLQS